MIIVSNNHDEKYYFKYLLLACTFIIKIGDRSTLALLQITGRSTTGGNGRQFIKIMGLAYSLIVTCRNESNTW